MNERLSTAASEDYRGTTDSQELSCAAGRTLFNQHERQFQPTMKAHRGLYSRKSLIDQEETLPKFALQLLRAGLDRTPSPWP